MPTPLYFDLQLFAEASTEATTEASTEASAGAPEGASTTPKVETADKSGDTFSREYVEKLRRSIAETEKSYKELKAKQDAAETKALEDEKRFRELYEKSQAERDAEKKQFMDELSARDKRAVMGEVRAAAASAGIIDTADIKLLDMDKFKLEEDGTVAGLVDAVADLKTRKPYLFKDTKQTINKENKEKAVPPNENGAPPAPKDWLKATDEEFADAWGKLTGRRK